MAEEESKSRSADLLYAAVKQIGIERVIPALLETTALKKEV